MKILNSILLGLIFLTLLSILYIETFSRIKYETRIVNYEDYSLSYELGKDGDNGWQIVGSRRALNEVNKGMYELILQRKKVNDFFFN